jgi:hypothetical protein
MVRPRCDLRGQPKDVGQQRRTPGGHQDSKTGLIQWEHPTYCGDWATAVRAMLDMDGFDVAPVRSRSAYN